ncbi:MAG: hypothetical protein KY459_11345 [Acidobacteria bacterium]|nr:hypothetical protein [Acidobacteriota bacterium]
MQLWKQLVLVFATIIATGPATAAASLAPPLDPAPLGEQVGTGRGVAVVGLDQTMLSIFAFPAGLREPDFFYARAHSASGELAGPPEFVGSGYHAAAASARNTAVVVWADDGVLAAVVDHNGRTLFGPVRVPEGRAQTTVFVPGIDSVFAAPLNGGWVIIWNENRFVDDHPEPRIAATAKRVVVSHDLAIVSPTREIISSGEVYQVLNVGDGLVITGCDPNPFIARISGDDLIDRRPFEGSRLAYNGSLIAAVRSSIGGFSFTTLSPATLETRHSRHIEWPESTRIELSWNGYEWVVVSRIDHPLEWSLGRLSEDGVLLQSSPVEIEPVEHLAYVHGALWGLSPLRNHPAHLFRFESGTFERRALLSVRASDTWFVGLQPLSSGNRLLAYQLQGEIVTTLVTPAGDVVGIDLSLGKPRAVTFDVHREFLYSAATYDGGETLVVRKYDRTGRVPELLATRELDAGGLVNRILIDAGEKGLIARFSVGAIGEERQLRLARLDANLDLIAERSLDPDLQWGALALLGDRTVLLFSDFDQWIEILDRNLDPVRPARPIVPRWANPYPLLSASADESRLLLVWINNNDHVRTVAVDRDGEIVNGADGGEVVALGGAWDSSLTAEARPDGWQLSWISADSFSCELERSIHRIRVDADGKLVTPFPHEPVYRFVQLVANEMICDASSLILSADGSAVGYSIHQFDSPWSGARRFVLHLSAHRARPSIRR